MRRAKVDQNQADIVSALRRAGASVELLHRVGGGVPDLLVGYQGVDMTMEVKMPGEKPNDLQLSWHFMWKGRRVAVVRSEDEAISAMLAAVGMSQISSART